MGDNGIVRETAHNNVDRKKYGENYDRIFGKKKKKKNLTSDDEAKRSEMNPETKNEDQS